MPAWVKGSVFPPYSLKRDRGYSVFLARLDVGEQGGVANGYRATRVKLNFHPFGGIASFRPCLVSAVHNCPAYLFCARSN